MNKWLNRRKRQALPNNEPTSINNLKNEIAEALETVTRDRHFCNYEA